MGSINVIKPLLPTALSSCAADYPQQHQEFRKKSWESRVSNPGPLGGKQERYSLPSILVLKDSEMDKSSHRTLKEFLVVPSSKISFSSIQMKTGLLFGRRSKISFVDWRHNSSKAATVLNLVAATWWLLR